MAHLRRKFSLLTSVLLIGLGSACAADPARPQELIGTYVLTQMIVTPPGGAPTDLRAVGASGTLSLATGASSSGQLVVPTTAATGTGGTLSLAGDWAVNNGALTVSTATDSFLRTEPLTIQGGNLVGDQTFSNTRIQITFTRQ